MYEDSKNLCRENARYSETPSFKYTGGPMGDDVVAEDHISSMTPCRPATNRLTKDQRWSIVGHYNYDERAGNIDRGEQGEVSPIDI
jgi:hypothetical protein